MKRFNLFLALGAVALLALSGIAVAKDRRGDDHGGHHGRHHHHEFEMRETGTVSSFDAATGRLTIALAGGDSVTGLVTRATEIKCEGVDDRLQRRDHGSDDNGGRGAEPGDDHGGRGNEPSDDNGGHGNEPGDDNGGEAPAPAPQPEAGTPPAPAPVEATCSTASLTPGAVVGEAELRLERGSAVFEEIELGFHS
jgi:hypothetical protein